MTARGFHPVRFARRLEAGAIKRWGRSFAPCAIDVLQSCAGVGLRRAENRSRCTPNHCIFRAMLGGWRAIRRAKDRSEAAKRW